ncbi:MAG TPA: DsrE/DsrF/DrsH-like family protein [Symbiobacteriaceae bacterium]|jgi:peroxiredoxin family protein|nr:DsrE/DsrF/DrsH-like family protein [Symbiobacteriaceae bacterium]
MSKKLAIIAANGGLDAAYKVLNIATAAAAMDTEVAIFFTFEGLKLIHKQANAQLPLPASMEGMQEAFQVHNVPTVPELIEMAQEMGVKFIACQMTMDLMGITSADLVDGHEVGGAATFLAFATEADVSLTF